MSKKGINKYGIKLEDHVDYASYRRACTNAAVKAYFSTEEGKLAKYKTYAKYAKTEKGKLTINNYLKSDQFKSVQNKYKKGNGKSFILANINKRRASRLQRTPAWADLEAIKQFYLNCPKGYHVDHIVPLQGVNVSGFHVLNNLQYLTAAENCSKGNKYDV